MIKSGKIEKEYNNIPELVFRILIVVFEVIAFVGVFNRSGMAAMVFYTEESNLILLITSAIYVFAWLKTRGKIPKWVNTLQYIATCLVAVTFITVIFVLTPMLVPYGADAVTHLYFGGSSPFTHLLCPILAIISCVLIEKEYVPDMKNALYAAVPTILYAAVTTLLNILKVLEGPYPFLLVYEQPAAVSVMWFFAIPGAGFGIAVLIRWLMKKHNRR